MPVAKAKPVNRIESNGAAKPADLFSLGDLKVKVIGLTPLLCANPQCMEPESNDPTRTKKSKDTSPAAICRTAGYFDADGHCAFPNKALHSAILDAAELMKLKVGTGRFAPSAHQMLIAGLSFDWNINLVKLCDPKTMKPFTDKDYVIDMQRAVNQNTGNGVVAIRPRFDKWAAIFHLKVDTSNANVMSLIDSYFDDILRYAGISVGIGAFRAYIKKKGKPGGRGPYGKFSGQIWDG